MPKPNEVIKALSQEDMTVLGNIKSLIDEMMSMSQQAPPAEKQENPEKPPVLPEQGEGVVAAAEDEECIEEKPMKSVKPEVNKQSSEGPFVESPSDAIDATGPAEQVMDEKLQEQTEDNLAALSKSFISMMKAMIGQQPQAVKKSENPMVEAMNTMMEAIKATNAKVDTLANLYEDDLTARGVFKQLEIAQKTEVSKERNPISNPDSADVVKYLADVLAQVAKSKDAGDDEIVNPTVSSNARLINKNLRDPQVLKHLLPEDSYNRLMKQGEDE